MKSFLLFHVEKYNNTNSTHYTHLIYTHTYAALQVHCKIFFKKCFSTNSQLQMKIQNHANQTFIPTKFQQIKYSKILHRISQICILTIYSVMPNSEWPCGLQPARLLSPWDSLGKNTGVGCHAFLQGIFPTQRSNPPFLPLSALPGGFFTHLGTW